MPSARMADEVYRAKSQIFDKGYGIVYVLIHTKLAAFAIPMLGEVMAHTGGDQSIVG